MSSFDWESFLRQWSQETIDAIDRDREDLPSEVLKSGWLGYPGATKAQIARAEARLGRSLPPSYQAFLRVTNGWRQTSLFSNKLWSLEDIEWFAVRHQAWINAFLEKTEQSSSDSSNSKAPTSSISDAEYFVYGDEQDCSKIRVSYLQTALEISQLGDGTIYLLNPQIVTLDGEWEAWFFGDWLPGADRYRSFQDMMQAEYESFLELRETPMPTVTAEAEPEPEPDSHPPPASTAIAVPPVPEQAPIPIRAASAAAVSEDWHDLGSFTIEFQTSRGRTDPRSLIHHRQSQAVATRPGLDLEAIQQWMLQHISPSRDQGAAAASVGVEITQLRVIRAPQTESTLVVDPQQPLFSDPIQRGERFRLEVSMHVVGSALARQLDRQLVYRARCVARHLSTRLDTDLGDITTRLASDDQLTYTAQFPEAQLQQPGPYQLKVWVTLQNVSALPGYFKIPILLVV